MENNFLKISFKEYIYKNIKDLYFIENKEILYYDGSHMNYIYKIKIDDIFYTFYGFYKEKYFTIIFNSYDSKLDITIKNKLTLLLNLDWNLKNISDKSIWIINIKNNYNKECSLLPISNKMIENNISIEDFIKISNVKKIKFTIKLVNIIDKNKNYNLIYKLRSYLNFSNKEIDN